MAEPIVPPASTGPTMLSAPHICSAPHSTPLYAPKKIMKPDIEMPINLLKAATERRAPISRGTWPNSLFQKYIAHSAPTMVPRTAPSATRASHGASWTARRDIHRSWRLWALARSLGVKSSQVKSGREEGELMRMMMDVSTVEYKSVWQMNVNVNVPGWQI